mmetsp:Transcript_2813/g.8591  ORF Transcript_2813/g.8591 Transcript_2813/m.8591 type:complete len:216 (-) Transcript_2813:877-1524(-)
MDSFLKERSLDSLPVFCLEPNSSTDMKSEWLRDVRPCASKNSSSSAPAQLVLLVNIFEADSPRLTSVSPAFCIFGAQTSVSVSVSAKAFTTRLSATGHQLDVVRTLGASYLFFAQLERSFGPVAGPLPFSFLFPRVSSATRATQSALSPHEARDGLYISAFARRKAASYRQWRSLPLPPIGGSTRLRANVFPHGVLRPMTQLLKTCQHPLQLHSR